MSKKLFSRTACVFFMVFVFVSVSAQELVFPINGNPVIKQYLKAHPSELSMRRVLSDGDTLPLPFIDDFSRRGIYPYDSLWYDRDAFVNSTFSSHPVTIGVATLDGIDRFGNPYDPFSSISDVADFLTSRPIHLNLPFDTTIWLSFYYQPQGLGDAPETDDSLALQFKNSLGTWDVVWSALGRSDSAFKRVNIHVNDTSYKYDGFQFRFLNYATINGNRDHWNIDYVILGKNRFANDSIRDNALINPQQSLLKNFKSMPYPHYKHLNASQIDQMKTSITDTAFNINYGVTSLTYFAEVNDESGTNLFTSGFNIQNTSSNTLSIFNSPMNGFVFPSMAGNSATFSVKGYLSQNGNASLPYNDTNYYSQNFYNYYAYDDGTAEFGYGIPEAGAKIAYQFDVKMRDTLRGVQMYFNQVGDVVHNKLFQLCLWSSINVSANTDQLVYKTIDLRPENIDSINGFATYLFDTILIVDPGNIWVGWIQNDATLLGIGLDRNTISTNKMFAFYTGYWHQSQIAGSWMMRPIFGDTVVNPIGINEPASNVLSALVYPNPASEFVSVDVRDGHNSSLTYRLFNNLGELILSGPVSSGRIHVSSLANGFYLLEITDSNLNFSVTKKLVVQHE